MKKRKTKLIHRRNSSSRRQDALASSSPKTENRSDNVVEDALDALEAFFDDDSDDDDHPKDDTDTFDVNDVEKKKTKKKESVGDQITLDQLLLAFKATAAGRHARTYDPAVGKYVFEKESADMACMLFRNAERA